MKHFPTKLALLISLIGAGTPAYSFVQANAWPADPATPETAFTQAPSETALDRTRWAPGLVWRLNTDEFDGTLVSKTSTASDLDLDEWAPGEGPARQPQRSVAENIDDAKRGKADALLSPALLEATVVARAAPIGPTIAKTWTREGERRRVKRGEVKLFHSDLHTGVTRRLYRTDLLVRVPHNELVASSQRRGPTVSERASARVANLQATTIAGDVTRGSITVAAISAVAPAASVHTERLMESLAAIVLEDMTPLNGGRFADQSDDRAVTTSLDRLAADGLSPTAQAAAQAGEPTASARAEPRMIVVATQADKVLRSLGAILSDERDEVGAIRSDALVATQTDKVLEALRDASSVHNQVEDGAARRARKLNAAKLSKDAATRMDIGVREPSTLDDQSIHIARTLKSVIPIDTASAPPAELDIDLTLTDTLATAKERSLHRNPFGGERVAVAETALDVVRGGFVTDTLNISFGIERAVYINGALVTTTSFNSSDLGRINGGRGSAALDSATVALVQNGTGNTVSAGSISSAAISTVVQNTLDGQKIQSLTVVNASVNSLGVLRGLNLQSSLRGAVIDSLRR